mgnify:FL=1
MRKPVCLVIGAGAGIGGHAGKAFALAGYHACLCRRTDGSGLDKIVNDIVSAGGEATGYLLNVVEPDRLENLIESIENDIGPIEVVIYNLGAQVGHRALADTSYKTFETGWRLGTFGLYRVAFNLFPRMVARGGGTLLVTSATAAMRGNAGQASHAAAMGGRRMLCQSLNAEFAAQGIHVAHILIDGAVDAPDTLGKMLGPEKYRALRERKGLEHDGLILPEKLAETYLHLARQHRSTWTHELDIRAYTDLAWWNHRGGQDF